MRKDYTKPLLEIKEYETNKVLASLDVSNSELKWTDDGTKGNYKEFEW